MTPGFVSITTQGVHEVVMRGQAGYVAVHPEMELEMLLACFSSEAVSAHARKVLPQWLQPEDMIYGFLLRSASWDFQLLELRSALRFLFQKCNGVVLVNPNLCSGLVKMIDDIRSKYQPRPPVEDVVGQFSAGLKLFCES